MAAWLKNTHGKEASKMKFIEIENILLIDKEKIEEFNSMAVYLSRQKGWDRMKPQEVIDIVGHKSAFEATDGIMNDE